MNPRRQRSPLQPATWLVSLLAIALPPSYGRRYHIDTFYQYNITYIKGLRPSWPGRWHRDETFRRARHQLSDRVPANTHNPVARAIFRSAYAICLAHRTQACDTELCLHEGFWVSCRRWLNAPSAPLALVPLGTSGMPHAHHSGTV